MWSCLTCMHYSKTEKVIYKTTAGVEFEVGENGHWCGTACKPIPGIIIKGKDLPDVQECNFHLPIEI